MIQKRDVNMQVFDISKRFEQFTNTAREVQFDLNFGLLLLVKCSSLSKTTFLLLGKCSLVRILVSYCSESAIRFGLGFLTARKVHFTIENHFLVARKVQFASDWGFSLLGKYISLSKSTFLLLGK